MSPVVFFDLLKSHQLSRDERCDICVVGAGAVGIYLTAALASKGFDVILVEAGGSTCSKASEVGFEAGFLGKSYPGATEGRAFGLGGTTSVWGGVLVPHSQADLSGPCDPRCSSWSHVVKTVSDKTDKVLATLGYRDSGEFIAFARTHLRGASEALDASGLDVAASLSLPFRNRNVAFLLDKKPANRSRIRVYLNAVAKSWAVESNNAHRASLKQLVAVAKNGNTLKVASNRFLIAAGAIESARILLELASSSSRPVLRPSAAVGCYLADHLSVTIADVAPSSRADAIRLFAPRFSQGWMRSFRFVDSDPPEGAPRAFAHFIFENENPGFLLAREVLGAMQQRRKPRVSCSRVASGVGGLMALAHARYFQSKLHVPSRSASHLQMDIEQVQSRANRISLGHEKDPYGRRLAEIRWQVTEIDWSNIQKMATRILGKWPGTKGGLPELIPRDIVSDFTKPHDAYHPVGTCRMGSDPEAVVDHDLKVWGVDNLWVVSTAVLPSAGTANPTFSILCLAEALCDHLTHGPPTSRYI